MSDYSRVKTQYSNFMLTLLFGKSLTICLTVAEISNSVNKSNYLIQHSYHIIHNKIVLRVNLLRASIL